MRCVRSIERSLAAGGLRRNAPDPVPVLVLVLVRLAVDQTAQGRGVGVALLADVVERTLAATATIGFRALVIHRRDDNALAFNRRWLPVEPLPVSPLHVYVPVQRLSAGR